MHIFSVVLLALTLPVSRGEAAKPWYIDEVSSLLMKNIVDMRNTNVPESEASSIAKSAIDGALSPPQMTPLVQSMADVLAVEGAHIKPSEALDLATKANAAYSQIRKSPGFGNYLGFISLEATKFNTKEITNLADSPSSSSLRSMIEGELSVLQQDAQGRQAIAELKQLANTIAKDAGVHVRF